MSARQIAGGLQRVEYGYDDYNKRISTTRGDYSVSIARDWQTNTLTKTDTLGRQVVECFNEDFQTTQETDAMGNVTQYAYDPVSKKRIWQIDPLGRKTSWDYDSRGNLVQTTYPDGSVETWVYNTIYGKECLMSHTDVGGRTTTYTYSTKGNMLSQVDAAGNATYYTYTATGKVQTIADKMGNTTTYAYNSDDNLQSVTDALGNSETRTYNAVADVVSTTDKAGNTTNYEYDDNRRLVKTILPPDSNGQRAELVTQYRSDGKVIRSVDGAGNPTNYLYDNYSRLLMTVDSMGAPSENTYDSAGRRKTSKDSRANVVTYNYDALNRVVSTVDPLGNTNVSTYDTVGRRVTTTDKAGHVTTMVYDSLRDWVNEIHHPNGTVTSFEYNTLGQRTAMVDPSGKRVEFEYDILGRQILRRRFLEGQPLITQYEFDKNGNQVKIIDEAGRETTNVYNELNQLVATIQPSPDGSSVGPTTTREYTKTGRLAKLTKPNGAEWSFGYDALGRVRWEEDPLGLRKSYVHDINGNVVQKTDPKGQVTTYEYDSLSRLTRVDYADGEWATFSYDSEGNRTNLSGSNGITIASTFDELNRIKTISNASLEREIEYSYTANGQKSSMTLNNLVDGSSKVTNYNFDEMNRLESIQPWTGNTVSYSFNLDGSRDSVNLPNNLTLHYSYDSLGRLLGMEYLNGNGQQVAFFNYTLDAAGNRTTMTDTEGLTEFHYDDLDRLTEAIYPDGTWERFTMDIAGRRTRHEDQDGVSDYHYDIGDRLHSITGTNATTFTWDMNGKHDGEGHE